jgi:hypothetical protein
MSRWWTPGPFSSRITESCAVFPPLGVALSLQIRRAFLAMTRQKLATWAVFAVLLFLSALPAAGEWNEQALYSFQGIPDGAAPIGRIVFDSSGNLYGATADGGSSSCISIVQCGTVYQLAQNHGVWTETVLYVFQGSAMKDGASPYGGLVMDGLGNLYGTTAYGGTGDCVLLGSKVGCGTVFELSPPGQKGGYWTEAVIYSFPSSKYGYVPWGDLVFDSAGNLYGATLFGGGEGSTCDPFYQYCGVVFELSPPKKKGAAWTEKALHAFKGITSGQQNGDGAEPNGGLVLDNKGAIYGTTKLGGYNCAHHSSQGCGTAFKLAPRNKGGAWTETILHSFRDVPDGATPLAGMTFGKNSMLYGTTEYGGGGNFPSGTVFQLFRANGTWTEQILHSFEDAHDGGEPSSGVVLDEKGDIYGTAASGGGASRYGVLFRLKPPSREEGSWILLSLYAFTGPPDGGQPAAAVVMDKDGNRYSTTQYGGTGTNCYGATGGCGTVFEASP